MTDQFPKNRGGWSGPGRTAAYTLAGNGDDSLTWGRKRRFGAEARNKGGHLSVRLDPTEAQIDGWYSLGTEEGKAVIRGSGSARGSFRLVGDAAASGSNIPQLFPRGDGSAYALHSLTADGFRTSMFGSNNPAFKIAYYITRDGKTPTMRPEVTLVGGYVSTRYTPLIVLPATSGARRANKYEFAFAYSALDGLQHVINVTFDDGETQRTVIAARNDFNMIFPLAFNRLGPSTYIGMGGSYAYPGTSPPPGYAHANVPGIFFFATADAGTTWTTFTDPALIAYEQANLQAFLLDEPYPGWVDNYNDVTASVGAQFVPLSRTSAFVWAMLGSREEVTGGNAEYYRIRYGVANLLGDTLSLEATMYEPPVVAAGTDYYRKVFPRYERNAVLAPGGGALVQFNDADYNASWTANPQLYYTTTGILGSVGTMNAQAGKTGIPVAVSASKLFMPIYDTEYSLYESSDRGLNWTKRAKISDVAAAPVTGGQYDNVGLRSFANVVWLRDNGVAKNATPGAPWLSDDRITPP